MKEINLSNLKHERKTCKSGVRYKPTFLKMFKVVATSKGLSMATLVESYVMKEYKKLMKEGKKNG